MYAGKRLTKASKKGNPARYNFSVMSMMTKTSDLGYLIRVRNSARCIYESVHGSEVAKRGNRNRRRILSGTSLVRKGSERVHSLIYLASEGEVDKYDPCS